MTQTYPKGYASYWNAYIDDVKIQNWQILIENKLIEEHNSCLAPSYTLVIFYDN